MFSIRMFSIRKRIPDWPGTELKKETPLVWEVLAANSTNTRTSVRTNLCMWQG